MKTPKTLTGRDATCFCCWNTINFWIQCGSGHTNSLAKFVVIPNMSKNWPRSPEAVRVGAKAPSERSFFYILQMNPIFFHSVLPTWLGCMTSFVPFCHFMIFLQFFRWKHLKHWPDVTQRAIGVEIRSIFGFNVGVGIPAHLQNLRPFRICQKVDLILRIPFG